MESSSVTQAVRERQAGAAGAGRPFSPATGERATWDLCVRAREGDRVSGPTAAVTATATEASKEALRGREGERMAAHDDDGRPAPAAPGRGTALPTARPAGTPATAAGGAGALPRVPPRAASQHARIDCGPFDTIDQVPILIGYEGVVRGPICWWLDGWNEILSSLHSL